MSTSSTGRTGWSRREALTVAALSVVEACRRRATNRGALRLGYMQNLTHAPALTGIASGRIARAIGAATLDAKAFHAGPAMIGAMLAGAIDACFVGPIPAASGFLRSHGAGLKVVAGATSGGAVFVVRSGRNIRGPGDLHGKRVATPQLGNTQDVALRFYLREHGLATTELGGDVTVTCMENPNILTVFHQGALDGAWVPEPWASRLIADGGEVLLDERDLWPGRAFSSTVLVVRGDYLTGAGDVVDALLGAHAEEVRRLRAGGDAARDEAGHALEAVGARALPPSLLAAAWPRMSFTVDPLRASVEEMARRAQALGHLPQASLAGLFDERSVSRARAVAGAS